MKMQQGSIVKEQLQCGKKELEDRIAEMKEKILVNVKRKSMLGQVMVTIVSYRQTFWYL